MRIVMRFHFPNLDRPKKAAKRIARLLGGAPALSKVQNGLAIALGYRDWHELELAHAASPPLPLDQDLPAEEFHQRSAHLVLRLAKAMEISDSEAQYVLTDSRLTGDLVTHDDQFAIRMACWRINGQWPLAGMAGTVVRVPDYFAGPRQRGILTVAYDVSSEHQPVQVITDNRCGACSRHEITFPQVTEAAFVPHRLRFAYGAWAEAGGTHVLFSRDYAPMWRLRDGLPPQQVMSTDWIRFESQELFWEDATAPWDDPRRIAEEEERLKSFGIKGLPQLVDLLPAMVDSIGNVEHASDLLDKLRRRGALDAYKATVFLRPLTSDGNRLASAEREVRRPEFKAMSVDDAFKLSAEWIAGERNPLNDEVVHLAITRVKDGKVFEKPVRDHNIHPLEVNR
jgi:hypothetical protein